MTNNDPTRTPALLDLVRAKREAISADEAHNGERHHTRNKRKWREAGALVDDWRKTPEGKEARNADQRDAYAKMIESTEGRAVGTYNKNPSAEDRAAQVRAASRRYRDKKKKEKQERDEREAAETRAKLAARAIV